MQQSNQLTSAEFSQGLAIYLSTLSPKHLCVMETFVKAGADLLVRTSDNLHIFQIAALSGWRSDALLPLLRPHEANQQKQAEQQAYMSYAYRSQASRDARSKSLVKFDESYVLFQSHIANVSSWKVTTSGALNSNKLLKDLSELRQDYVSGQIMLSEFKAKCACSIGTALNSELCVRPASRDVLLALLDTILALTVIVPIVAMLTTGRLGFFTNTIEAETSSYVRNIATDAESVQKAEISSEESQTNSTTLAGPLYPKWN